MANGEPVKKGLRFSPEINAGNVLNASMLLLGIIGGYATFYSRLTILEYRQVQTDQMVTELKNGSAQIGLAVQELKTANVRLMILIEQTPKQIK